MEIIKTNKLDFNQVYNLYYNELVYFINTKIHSLENSEDVVNEVFVKAHKNWNNYDESKSKINTWLYNIAKNTMIDYIRANKSMNYTCISDFTDESGKELFQFASDNQSDKQVLRTELSNKIEKAFNKLNKKYREISKLYFIDDLSYNEIVEVLDIPLGTVKGTLNRCRELLQNELKRAKIEYEIY